MAGLPHGTVTFLFSDIEGSTRRWEHQSDGMAGVLARHDQILGAAIAEAGGHLVKHTGDGVLAAFGAASAAVRAAVAIQLALAAEPWPDEPLRARIGLHSGEAIEVEGDYFGPALNRAARVMATGWGGQILCSGATAQLVEDRLPEGIGLRNLGEHRLRDLDRPLTLWQVLHPRLRVDHPPLRSLDRAIGNVPIGLSSFVGRRREVADIVDELRRARVLTLTGPGGVGKTRLALEVAAEEQHDRRDGVWVCELAPLADPGAVPGVVAATFGIVQQPGRSLTETLTEYLAPREVVLVLDNCEHLLDAAAETAEAVCRGCPDVHVLATSRAPLDIEGEQVHAVRPLEEQEAVELFVERARATQATFVADDATREICRRLDGIPLALEMAAARVRSMRPREIAARLDERFRLLVAGRRAPDRQQTLRATVAWSHDLLDERERRIFRRLAVFAGTFGLPAAEAVTSDDELDEIDVDALLDSLVAKSLVVAEEGVDDAIRYRLLETIRQFAQEQLVEAGEDGDRRRRHAGWYSEFVALAAGGLRGEDEPLWSDRVAEELDNLRAAESWAQARGDAALALALFAPMPPTSLAEPVSYEIFTWVDDAMDLADASANPNYWPALNWLCLRSQNLLAADQLGARLDRVQRLRGWDAHPEAHFGQALLELIIGGGDLAAAAAAYGRAATGYTQSLDRYHEIRHRAMSLYCRAQINVDERVRTEIAELIADARDVGSPYMTAFGIGCPTSSAAMIFDDPATALQRLQEADTYAVRSRNPLMHRSGAGARVLALTVLGDPRGLSQEFDELVLTRNHNQLSLQVSALAIAFELMGRHEVAAELIGANTSEALRNAAMLRIQQVQESWARTRAALGQAAYDEAVARGAARTTGELIDWLREVTSQIDETAVRPPPEIPGPSQ